MGRRVTSCSAIASSALPKDIVAVYSLSGANCTCCTHVIPMAGTTAMGPSHHPKIRQWAQLAAFRISPTDRTTPDWPQSSVSAENVHFHCLLEQRILWLLANKEYHINELFSKTIKLAKTPDFLS